MIMLIPSMQGEKQQSSMKPSKAMVKFRMIMSNVSSEA